MFVYKKIIIIQLTPVLLRNILLHIEGANCVFCIENPVIVENLQITY